MNSEPQVVSYPKPPSEPNNRSAHRLEIARGLLHLDASADMLKILKQMPVFQFWHFQQLTDWVEEYENYEPNQRK